MGRGLILLAILVTGCSAAAPSTDPDPNAVPIGGPKSTGSQGAAIKVNPNGNFAPPSRKGN